MPPFDGYSIDSEPDRLTIRQQGALDDEPRTIVVPWEYLDELIADLQRVREEAARRESDQTGGRLTVVPRPDPE